MYRQEKVLVVAPLMVIICDNPHASELVNYLGSAANKFCRICEVHEKHLDYSTYALFLG